MLKQADMVENLNIRQEAISLKEIDTAVIIGVGGIGSWVSFTMSLTGRVKFMILIDPQTIEESNLNRTPFRVADVGLYKVDALKYLILERRAIEVAIFREKTSELLKKELVDLCYKMFGYENKYVMEENTVVIDCRDDVFKDFYDFPGKYYKVGYDGLEITLDGDPKNTPIWGQANGYRFVPSFVCPSQLAANLVIIDILTKQEENTNEKYSSYKCDEEGRLNDSVTFNSQYLIRDLSMMINNQSRGTPNVS